ncbi:MAG: RNA polymerase sigma factor [Candidatus Pseudobacter hemicellulosilyticus]|uniref:RNA polymerase sigma factor n=1 Tax=Candidatus Pseudobacter hemicellulosilyticus TaxID=3121375 RepID=A0AAJ5WSY9_9BACT|nr:MAG: RNA polymerase sigma factor [Pseudobacter sp.]
MMHPPDDHDLVESLKTGSHPAYTLLFERYWKTVFNTVFRKTGHEQAALDITQEIFFLLWEKRAQLEIRGPLLHWLHGVIRYKVIDWFRESTRQLEQKDHLLSVLAQQYARAVPAEDNLLNYDKAYSLWLQYANQLPGRMKEIYLLSKIEGRSIAEIAGLLSLKPQSVKNHLQRASDRVYEQMRSAVSFGCSLLLLSGLMT